MSENGSSPDGLHMPYGPANKASNDSWLGTDPATKLEDGGAAPPAAAGSAGGGGDGDGGHGELLRKFGRAGEKLPALIGGLEAERVECYLRGTSNGFSRWLGNKWKGWATRVAMDGEFPFKVLMEETMGLGLCASGMIAARGKEILNELDFAFCDVAVGATLNFIVVYLLAPTVGGGGGIGAKLPANVFSSGGYSILSRAGGFVYKGVLFAGCGFAGSLVGTSLSKVLIGVRRIFGAGGEKELPNVVINSAAWAGFMFVSSNPRYQLVAGMERGLFKFAPGAVAKLGSAMLRTGNNVLGGAQWVWWARAIGVQEAPKTDKGDDEE